MFKRREYSWREIEKVATARTESTSDKPTVEVRVYFSGAKADPSSDSEHSWVPGARVSLPAGWSLPNNKLAELLEKYRYNYQEVR
jgi:hypothetical protein